MDAHRLARLFGLPAALMLAVGIFGTASGVASASTCLSWTGVPPVSPSASGDTLASVAARSPCDVWAVGTYRGSSAYQTLVEHWDGTSWTFMLSGNPGGFNQNSYLTGVAAVPAARPWAVGFYSTGTASRAFIEAPKNGVWTLVPSADPGGPGHDDSILVGVAATSAKNAWAVGDYLPGTARLTLIEHWNGTAWRQVPSPDPSHANNVLHGIAATSAKNAWTVGWIANSQNAYQTLILHWNGTMWKRAPSQNPGGSSNDNILQAVAAVSASNAWAVGSAFTTGFAQPLIEHWNGKAWRSVPAPSPSPSVPSWLTGVTAISARDAWAVGSYGSTDQHTLIEHWNGKSWRRVRSPSPGLSAVLVGVASSRTSIWAVGYYNSGGPAQTLAVHCC